MVPGPCWQWKPPTPEDTPELDAARTRLAGLYEAYTAKYGPVNRYTESVRVDKETGEELVTRRQAPAVKLLARVDPFGSLPGRGRHSPTTADIVRATGISRAAATKALTAMEAVSMIKRHGRTWAVTTPSLTDLAARLGVYQAHISRVRRERANWRAYLDRFKDGRINEAELHDPERERWWAPSPDAAVWEEQLLRIA